MGVPVGMQIDEAVAPDRFVWQPEDGWGPICAALDVPVPSEPFPRTNTSEEFRARFGWE